jgi:hypothetical protein
VADTGPTPITGIAVSGSTVIWAEPGPDGAVKMRDISTEPVVVNVLAEPLADPVIVAVQGADVYWTNQGTGNHDGSVMHCALPGPCSPPRLLARDQRRPYGLAVDADYVYWGNRDLDGPGGQALGEIRRVPRQ